METKLHKIIQQTKRKGITIKLLPSILTLLLMEEITFTHIAYTKNLRELLHKNNAQNYFLNTPILLDSVKSEPNILQPRGSYTISGEDTSSFNNRYGNEAEQNITFLNSKYSGSMNINTPGINNLTVSLNNVQVNDYAVLTATNNITLTAEDFFVKMDMRITANTINATIKNGTFQARVEFYPSSDSTIYLDNVQFTQSIVYGAKLVGNEYTTIIGNSITIPTRTFELEGMKEAILTNVSLRKGITSSVTKLTLDNITNASGNINVTTANTLILQNSTINATDIKSENTATLTSTITNSHISNILASANSDSILLDTSSANIIGLYDGDNTLSINNSTISGNITNNGYTGNNTIHINNSTISANILTHTGNDVYSIRDSTINTLNAGDGNNIISLTNSTVLGNISTGNDNDSVSITNIADIVSLDLGNGNNSLQLTNTNLSTNISSGTGDDSLYIVKGKMQDLTIGGGNNTISINESSLNALLLNSGNNTISINSSSITGALNGAGVNNVSVQNASIGGDINVAVLNVTASRLYLINTGATGSITRNIVADTINITNGAIQINPNVVGDTLSIQGTINAPNSKNPSFILDTNLVTGEIDTILFDGNITAQNNILLFSLNNIQPITMTNKAVKSIENVLKFTNNTNIVLPKVHIGGSMYKFTENTIPNTWDLVRSGASLYNTTFLNVQASNMHYTKSIWSSLRIRMDNTLLEYAKEKRNPAKIYTVRFKKKGKTFQKKKIKWSEDKTRDKFTLWAQAQAGVNTFSQNGAMATEEIVASGIFGLDIKRIDIKNIARFNFTFFASYGKTLGNLIDPNQELASVNSNITVLTTGLFTTFETLRNEYYKHFIRAGTWIDLFHNTLSYSGEERILSNRDKWGTYTINATLGTGMRLNARNFTIIPEISALYSYTPGMNFIASDTALISFKTRQSIVTQASLMVAYNFAVGIKPYIKVGIEIPFMIDNAEGIYVGDIIDKYSYNEKSLALLALGFNHSAKVKGLEISTYFDITTYISQTQLNLMGNFGLSIGF